MAIFYFLGRAFARNWQEIHSFHFNFDFFILGFASLIYAFSFFALAVGWWLILIYLHHPIGLYEAFLYFCITQPAKYIPGKIWIAVTRMRFCKPHGVSNSITLLSTGIESAMEIFAGSYISIIAILQSNALGKTSFWGAIVASGLGLLVLYPPIFYFLINIFLKIVRKPLLHKDRHVSFAKLLLLQIVYIAGIAGLSLSHFFFLQSFVPISISHLPFILGIGGFSYVASILALFVPSGFGVREGIWYLAMKRVSVPHVALIFSFASRIWTMIVEAILLFVALPLLWVHRRNLHKML